MESNPSLAEELGFPEGNRCPPNALRDPRYPWATWEACGKSYGCLNAGNSALPMEPGPV